MISARDLLITWGECPILYWTWISLAEARFPEVAELSGVCWFFDIHGEIRGKIDVCILSPLTTYAAYLVFKSTTPSAYGFEQLPVKTTFGLIGSETSKRNVYLDAKRQRNDNGTYPKKRKDGWLEVELGDFYYGGDGQDGELEMSVLGNWKRGFIFEGIEIRPKGVIN